MANVPSSGIVPGQRRLDGSQTTGPRISQLSHPTHAMAQDDDIAVPMRDGINLLADVHRPAEPGRYSRAGGRLSPIRVRSKTLARRPASLKPGPPISLSRVVTSTSLRIAGEPVDLVAASVSLIGRNAVTCTTSSSGPRSNPGPTEMLA